MQREKVVVLGAGYVARFLLSLTDLYQTVLYTSRNPERHLAWVPPQQRVQFDLSRPDTWGDLPSGADFLWCFPAEPLAAVRTFAHSIGSFNRLVVLGSTSAYDIGDSPEYPPPWLDETAPLDLNKPRVQGEEFLRHECGAIVLRVAGIYGPGRHPFNWIRTGRVTLSDKYVNLIHVEDLAASCLAALQCGAPGTVYNLSDGTPRTWREIGQRLSGDDIGDTGIQEQVSGKRINTTKLRALLQEAGLSIRYPDLFRSLERLHDEQSPG